MKGVTHDFVSVALTGPLASAAFTFFPPGYALTMVAGYTVGWVWLSPDMDLKQSNPSKRWGLLSILWRPYQKHRKHRGRSHWPLYGSFERLLYILVLLTPVALVGFATFGAPIDTETLLAAVRVYGPYLEAIYWGIEAACSLHVACDYVS